MRQTWMVMVVAMVLGGCAGIDVYYGEGRRMIIEHETNITRPSFTKVTTEVCVPDDTVEIIETKVDDKTYRCKGVYVATAPNFAAQEGAATGLGSAVVLGGAAVGTGFVFGSSMPGDDYNTTNNNDTSSNGGQTINSNANLNQAGASATNSNKNFNKNSNSSSSKSYGSKGHRR